MMLQHYTKEEWDELCSLKNINCSLTWLSPWEQLDVRIGTAALLIQHASASAFQQLRQDMRRRFDELQSITRLRFECITLLTSPPDHVILRDTELPIIGKLATPAGASAVAPKDAHRSKKETEK